MDFALVVLFKCLESSKDFALVVLFKWLSLTLVVLFKWLKSSMDFALVVLFKCLGSSMDFALVVLFKWLRSSMHVRLYTCLGTCTIVGEQGTEWLCLNDFAFRQFI